MSIELKVDLHVTGTITVPDDVVIVPPPVDPPIEPPIAPPGSTPNLCTIYFSQAMDNSYNRDKPNPNDKVILGDNSVNADMRKYDISSDEIRVFGYFVPPGCVKVALEAMDVLGEGWTKISYFAHGCNGQFSEGYQQKPNIVFWEDVSNQCDDLFGAVAFNNERDSVFTVAKMQIICTIGPTQEDADLFWDWYINGANGGTSFCSTQELVFNACSG